MKKFLYMAVAAIAALSSCQNEDTILESNTQKESEKVFTATMENCAGTRTTLANNTPNWENTDRVCIIGSSGSGIYKATPDATNQAKATLTKESGDAPSDYCIAYYPADYVTLNSEQQVIATLPAVHTYNDGKFNMPMFAMEENENTSNLRFNNLCGVLAVTVKGISDIKAVRVISASATDKLSGHFALGNQSQDGKIYAVMKETDTSNQVSVNCGTGVDADATTGKVFYFPLAPATYGKLQVVVESGTSTVAHMTTPTGVTIERNKIYSTTFDDSKQNGQTEVLHIYATTKTAEGNPSSPFECVTLWAGSPIFATINVGQTVTDYSTINTTVTDANKAEVYSTANVGGLYHWGGTINRRENTSAAIDCSSSTTDIAGTADDTATKLWGPIWRMPTKAELNHLRNYKDDSSAALATAVTTLTKCDGQTGEGHAQYVSGCTLFGYKVTGTGGFSGNSVFLPLAGSKYISGGVSYQSAYYRSSTPYNADGSLSLSFSSSSSAPYVCYDDKNNFSSVRAVLK